MLGIDVSWVYRWTYPHPKGTDGRVPAKHQSRLLKAAIDAGADLSPADFFDLSDDMREAS